MKFQSISQPKTRSALRKFFGKEFFIFKRRLIWLLKKSTYSAIDRNLKFENSLIMHKSFLLRPLKDVDMYLYLNKKHEAVVPRLAKALRDMKVDGTYNKIIFELLAE